MNGNSPHSGRPMCWKTPGCRRRCSAAARAAGRGRPSSRAIVRGSWRSCQSTRCAVATVARRAHRAGPSPARSDDRQERARRGRCSPVRARSSPAWSAEQRAVAHEQQAVAALGLVHHVARDEQRGAGCGEPVERSPRARGAGPDRGRRSARRGRAAPARFEQRGGERDRGPARRPTASRRSGPRGRRGRRREHLGHAVAADADEAREVAEVLGHREVAVDRRGLGDVADARSAAAREPARLAEHRRRCRRRRRCTPTIARIRVVLPHPLGPSSPVTEPRLDASETSRSTSCRLARRAGPRLESRSSAITEAVY